MGCTNQKEIIAQHEINELKDRLNKLEGFFAIFDRDLTIMAQAQLDLWEKLKKSN